MARRTGVAVAIALALTGALAVASAVMLLGGGIGTRQAPGALETRVARGVRSLAIPSSEKERRNPVPQTAATLRSGLEHFADHCASCHANDGSGDTVMGRSLYPRAPDMRRAATQSLSDGELFHIIEQGVKLTGMPAWSTGTPDGEAASWHLVQFIRHLPALSEYESEEMKALNPRSVDEWREEEEIRRFLAGDEPGPSDTPDHGRGGPR